MIRLHRPGPTGRPLLRRAVIAVIVACAVTTSIVFVPAAFANPTGPDPSATETGNNDPHAQYRASLDYLMTTYRISEGEALRRLKLQARSGDLVASVRKAVGDEYMDAWFDQDGGGRLVILTSEPAKARAALANGDANEAAFPRSTFTAAQLKAAAAELRQRLADAPEATVTIDTARQQIAVEYLKGDAAARTRVAQRASVPTAARVPVTVTTSPPNLSAGVQHAGTCTIMWCDPPMRGGLRLHVRRDNGTWGSCTSGFNVRGSNGALYVLTAGHCVSVPGPKRQFMYHNGLPALVEGNASGSFTDPNAPADARLWRNNFPTRDWALVPFQLTGATVWHQYWLTGRQLRNQVLSSCVAGQSPQSCTSRSYSISGVKPWNDMFLNAVVCATGTGNSDIYPANAGYSPGTRCGLLTSKTMSSYIDTTGGQALRVNICSRDGDSGGPLWSQFDGLAWGTLSGGPEKTGGCNLSDPDDYSVYSPSQLTLADATSTTGVTMSIISSAGG